MKKKDGRSIMNYILIAIGVAVCGAVFIIFGRKESEPIEPAPAEQRTPLPTTTPIPGGVTIEAFTQALLSSGMDCTIVGPERSADGGFLYRLEMQNPNDSGCVAIATDSLGRVTSCELRIGYLFIKDTGYTVGIIPIETIRQEYARRERVDRELIGSFLSAVFGVYGEYCGVGNVDLHTIGEAVRDAYAEQKSYSKKFGLARVGCATDVSDTSAEFLLELRFDLS